MGKDGEVYTLLDGRKMTTGELHDMYKYNYQNGFYPLTGCFCMECNHELIYTKDGYYVCGNCKEALM